ncbi:MAG: hypothetical protein HY600_05900, partial [Candidatus Omnitrophica bacterium]|nr:hypothetical protein [Candidatus Omnitrophota bacterium]
RGRHPRGLTPFAVVFVGALLAGCGPSYPQARVAQAVMDLCRREYQMDVQATLHGSTIAVFLQAPGLFETPVSITPETDPQTLTQSLRFSAGGMDQLQHVALVVRRVILSTDAPIKFYLVVIRDADQGEVELHWLGHILDLKRLNAYDISQGEFLKYRAVIYFRPVASALARRTVQQLFEDLRRRAPVPEISRHFSSQADPRAILPFLIQNLVPASRPGQGMATLAEVRARQIGPDTVLAFARALVPTSESPLVQEQGYYFLVQAAEFRGLVQRIVPVRLSEGPAPRGRWDIPAEFAPYGPPDQWTGETFFVEPVQLPQFLAEQVVRRVRLDVGAQPGVIGLAVNGEFVDGAFQFQFRLGVAADMPPAPPARRPDLRPESPQGVATAIAHTAASVFHAYDFTQFERVTINDVDSGGAWVVPAAELAAFRSRATALRPAVGP